MTLTDNMTKKLVKICYVCDQWEKGLKYRRQRFSNNNRPEFTDQEALCIYLYCMNVEHRLRVRDIYEFASVHLRSWFPEFRDLRESHKQFERSLLAKPPSMIYRFRNPFAIRSITALSLETKFIETRIFGCESMNPVALKCQLRSRASRDKATGKTPGESIRGLVFLRRFLRSTTD